jgi:DNA-binding transcriptional ArsR family regulator
MELTGLANATVQKALAVLEDARLLRIEKRGQRNYYVARERMDLRLGEILICTVVVDYAPARLREVLPRIKGL